VLQCAEVCRFHQKFGANLLSLPCWCPDLQARLAAPLRPQSGGHALRLDNEARMHLVGSTTGVLPRAETVRPRR
jgi:hypothetical protein